MALAIGTFATGMAFAQGTIAVYSINSTFATYINSTAYSSSLNGVYNTTGGKTAATANSYYYALLYQPYSAGLTTVNPLDSGYTLGMTAVNYTGFAGGIKGTGGSSGTAVAGWSAPTDPTYGTSEEANFVLVGWSANLGTTWSAVSAELSSGNWLADGYFGVSSLGYSYAGGGPNTLNAVNIFGVSQGAPGGLANGITLYSVSVVPEPCTMALLGLGGLSMFMIRRRK
jgi:hypothetical protein